MLRVDDVHVDYDAIHALRGVSFHVDKAELVTLLGANGAGKTTTLKTISGLLRPKRGTIELDGRSLAATSPDEVVRSGVAHVPEGRKIFPRLTVRENLELGAVARSDGDGIKADLNHAYHSFPF